MDYFKNVFFVTFLLSLLTFTSCEEDEEYYHDINFIKKSAMPGTGRASSVAFAINGKGYVALGRGISNSDLWEYTPETDTWTAKKAFPGKNRVKAVAQVINNKAYVGLGFVVGGGALTQSSYLSDFWCYDPSSNEWTSLAGFPGGGSDACISFVLNGTIYVGEGYSYLTPTNTFWAYVPSENRWRMLEDFTGNVRFASSGCSDGEKAFFGTGFNGTNLNDWWEYTASSDSWKERKSIPGKGRVNAVALAVSKRFFMSTGRYFNGKYNGGGVLSDILEFDPVKNKWHNRGNMPEGGRDNAVSFVIGNTAYIGFGDNDTGMLNDLWSFEP